LVSIIYQIGNASGQIHKLFNSLALRPDALLDVLEKLSPELGIDVNRAARQHLKMVMREREAIIQRMNVQWESIQRRQGKLGVELCAAEDFELMKSEWGHANLKELASDRSFLAGLERQLRAIEVGP